jgi:hypothetical protein
VTLSWNAVGFDEQSGPVPLGTALLAVTPCPVTEVPVIKFRLDENRYVVLSIYDICGRLIDVASGEFPEGQTEMTLSALSPGIYFVRMQAGEFTAMQRFAVVE